MILSKFLSQVFSSSQEIRDQLAIKSLQVYVKFDFCYLLWRTGAISHNEKKSCLLDTREHVVLRMDD